MGKVFLAGGKVNMSAKSYDKNTLLLLHGENFVDYSKNSLSVGNSGVTISSEKSRFGSNSFYFNGSARLTIPQIAFGSSDFTIDWWEYVTSSNSKVRFSSAYTTGNVCGGILLGYAGTQVYSSSNFHYSSWDLVSGAAMFSNTLNQWVHWATVRNGNTLTTYRNGTKFASTSISGSIATDNQYSMVIGDYRDGDHAPFIGYIDEFRISDVARWTSDFTPPIEAYEKENQIVRLPSGYIKLEYIQSGGAQYIDTGFIPNQDTTVIMDCKSTLGATVGSFFGGRVSYASRDFSMWNYSATSYLTNYAYTSKEFSGTTSGRHVIEKNKNKTYIDGILLNEITYTNFTSPVSLYVCATNENGSPDGRNFVGFIYSCKIYDNDTLVRDYVPAKRDSDGAIGLYDLVEKKFYTNNGTGSFTSSTSQPISGVALNSIAEGSTVYLNENGTPAEFYVAKHNYEQTLNGSGRTLLVRKSQFGTLAWNSAGVNTYANSTIDTWMNNNYKGVLDSNVVEAIGETKFYYTTGNGNYNVTTLSRAVFSLSLYEYGFSPSYANKEGSTLPISETLKETATTWSRTPVISNDEHTHAIYQTTTKTYTTYDVKNKMGVRPAMTIPSNSVFDEETLLFKGVS